jgi:hypothetical protein
MCITGHNVYNGQHQNVFGHHLEKKDGSGQWVDKEKKKDPLLNSRFSLLTIIMGENIHELFSQFIIYSKSGRLKDF